MIITNISRLITMEPGPGREGPLGVIRNASVEIKDGKIKKITSNIRHSRESGNPAVSSGLDPDFRRGDGLRWHDMQILDARGGVVVPGLIDCHTHLVHAGDRLDEFAMRARGATYGEIAVKGGGIMSTVRATRSADEDELFNLAGRRANEMLSCGVTTVEVKSGYGLDLSTELKMLRVIKRLNKELPQEFVPTFLGAHTVPEGMSFPRKRESSGCTGDPRLRGDDKLHVDDKRRYLALLIHEMLPAVAKERLAVFCDVFVEKIAFNKKEAEEIFRAAAKCGLKAKLHADQLSSCGGAALAARLKAVSADHLEHITEKDIKALARAGVVAVLIPSSTFFIRGRYAPARKLIKAGVKVAVSTDYNPGTSPILNLWLSAAMSVAQMKLTPEEAYAGITVNAARALGLHKTHGSISVGKVADVVILDTKNEFEPLYRFDKLFVSKVIKKGKLVCTTR
jgi:imidazolonepropionase